MFLAGTAYAATPVKILVFPLDAQSGAVNLAWLSEGIATSISGQLRGDGIKVVDREERFQMVEALDLPPDAHLSHGSMIRVAQQGNVDLIVLGTFEGSEQKIKVVIKTLDMKNLKLSGEMSAAGPLASLPQMENELAWLIINNGGLQKGITRKDFSNRVRKIPNTEYAAFIQSFGASDQNKQIELLRNSVEGFKDFPEAHFRLAKLYFRKGNWSNSLDHLSLSARDEISEVEYEFIKGTCLLQLGHPVEAIQSLTNVLGSLRSYRVLNNIGVAYLRQGDTPKALNSFMEARYLARSDTTVIINLVIARHLEGNAAAAQSILSEALKRHPKNRMMHFLSGIVLKDLGNMEEAAAPIAKAKELGLKTETLEKEDPGKWCLVHTEWQH